MATEDSHTLRIPAETGRLSKHSMCLSAPVESSSTLGGGHCTCSTLPGPPTPSTGHPVAPSEKAPTAGKCNTAQHTGFIGQAEQCTPPPLNEVLAPHYRHTTAGTGSQQVPAGRPTCPSRKVRFTADQGLAISHPSTDSIAAPA